MSYKDSFIENFKNPFDGKILLDDILKKDPDFYRKANDYALGDDKRLMRVAKNQAIFLSDEVKINNKKIIYSNRAKALLFPSKENELKRDIEYLKGKELANKAEKVKKPVFTKPIKIKAKKHIIRKVPQKVHKQIQIDEPEL